MGILTPEERAAKWLADWLADPTLAVWDYLQIECGMQDPGDLACRLAWNMATQDRGQE